MKKRKIFKTINEEFAKKYGKVYTKPNSNVIDAFMGVFIYHFMNSEWVYTFSYDVKLENGQIIANLTYTNEDCDGLQRVCFSNLANEKDMPIIDNIRKSCDGLDVIINP